MSQQNFTLHAFIKFLTQNITLPAYSPTHLKVHPTDIKFYPTVIKFFHTVTKIFHTVIKFHPTIIKFHTTGLKFHPTVKIVSYRHKFYTEITNCAILTLIYSAIFYM